MHSFDDQNVAVDVHYNPDHPAESRISAAPPWSDWFFGAIGGGMTVIGGVGFWGVFRYQRYAVSIGS